jgi:hypothetical protein
MHDKHGREIGVGDVVAVQERWDKPKLVAKLVTHTMPGSETCNIICDAYEIREGRQSHNAKDSVLLLKADGTIVGLPQEVTNGN